MLQVWWKKGREGGRKEGKKERRKELLHREPSRRTLDQEALNEKLPFPCPKRNLLTAIPVVSGTSTHNPMIVSTHPPSSQVESGIDHRAVSTSCDYSVQ